MPARLVQKVKSGLTAATLLLFAEQRYVTAGRLVLLRVASLSDHNAVAGLLCTSCLTHT